MNAEIQDKINARMCTFLEEIKRYPHFAEIEARMQEAQKKIGYTFENSAFLMLAFCRTKIKPGKKNYMNESLAQIGDFASTFFLGELYFSEGKGKQEIQKLREKRLCNSTFFNFTIKNDWPRFCYNKFHFYDDTNAPAQEKVSVNKHDSIIEAVVGAIYLDGGMDAARDWVYKNITDDTL